MLFKKRFFGVLDIRNTFTLYRTYYNTLVLNYLPSYHQPSALFLHVNLLMQKFSTPTFEIPLSENTIKNLGAGESSIASNFNFQIPVNQLILAQAERQNEYFQVFTVIEGGLLLDSTNPP